MPTERFLSSGLNAVVEIDGITGFIESLKRSGGNPERKKIGVGTTGFIMEQTAQRNPYEWEGVLMAPQTGTKAFIAVFTPGSKLTRLYTSLDDDTDIAEGGDAFITECDWDAAVMENEVLKVTVKIRQVGYVADTATSYIATP